MGVIGRFLGKKANGGRKLVNFNVIIVAFFCSCVKVGRLAT